LFQKISERNLSQTTAHYINSYDRSNTKNRNQLNLNFIFATLSPLSLSLYPHLKSLSNTNEKIYIVKIQGIYFSNRKQKKGNPKK